MCMCIAFLMQVSKQKNAHVSFPVGMVSRGTCSDSIAKLFHTCLCGVSQSPWREGGGSCTFLGVWHLSTLRSYRAIWGIAAIVSSKTKRRIHKTGVDENAKFPQLHGTFDTVVSKRNVHKSPSLIMDTPSCGNPFGPCR